MDEESLIQYLAKERPEGTRGSVLQRCHPWIGIVQDAFPSNSFMGSNEQSEKIKKLTPGRFLMIVCSYGASKSEQSMTFFPRDCEMQWTARSLGVSTVTPTKALSAAVEIKNLNAFSPINRAKTTRLWGEVTQVAKNSNNNEYMNIDEEVGKLKDVAQILVYPDRRPLPQCIQDLVLSHDEPVHGRITSDGPLPRRLS
ncbi:hypothetical protein Bca52824_034731 [Brassica carinata]|uniref:Uncharacterized protein n=1 Tax=Brassica carinata TaxID=52824 RepID=A0A8X7V134_BRACI|nr:hypothetical protein Bca52824_034731 [Brassica carinata]